MARSKPTEGGFTATPGRSPGWFWCLLTWKPLGRWCPVTGWAGRQLRPGRRPLTTRPFGGCGGRKLFTMWILSSSSEVKSRLREFLHLRQKRDTQGRMGELWSPLTPDTSSGIPCPARSAPLTPCPRACPASPTHFMFGTPKLSDLFTKRASEPGSCSCSSSSNLRSS